MFLVPSVDHAYRTLRCLPIILVGLLKLVFVTSVIDVFPRTALDEAEIVGADAYNRSIFFEQCVCIVRQLAFDTSKNEWILRDSVEDGARVLAQWMKENPVNRKTHEPQSPLDELANGISSNILGL